MESLAESEKNSILDRVAIKGLPLRKGYLTKDLEKIRKQDMKISEAKALGQRKVN